MNKDNIRKMGYIVLHKLLLKIKEYNKDKLKDNSYILCPNHTSDFDGPVLWTSNNNIRIMAKKKLFKNKLMAKFLNKMDVVSVDRSKHSAREIMQAVRYLKEGSEHKVFMLFPQGTISDINKNALARIKEGAFVISALSKTPIVPVFIEQPRIFRRSRIVYGNQLSLDILDEKEKIDRKKLLDARLIWQQEIFRLQQEAIELENRPIRKIKLSKKHANNNQG
ncbi:MAG: lysophospholipid acyltransferase family protein [Bacilli bacterium]|nr:lysophospholipid acyltransferase family protein [Bacilli bacterium]MDD4053344.1 lysophospholipid acyltransferase family protein [Bacilli bacterium]MDD4411009.1 lysophospholipid acyltransferase family protein [Bacilli bacterium]